MGVTAAAGNTHLANDKVWVMLPCVSAAMNAPLQETIPSVLDDRRADSVREAVYTVDPVRVVFTLP